MIRALLLVVGLLFSQIALAQHTPIGGSLTPGTGATNLGKAEDGAHSSGDVGVMGLGVVTTSQNCSFSTTNGDYVPLCISNGTGALHTSLRQSGWAADPVKAEDSPHTTADALMAIGCYASASPQTALAGEGDYVLPKTNLGGAMYVDVNINGQVNNGNGLLKFEDGAAADSHAGVAGLSVRQDTLSSSTGTDGDYGFTKQDASGSLWVQGATSSIFRSIDLDETEEDVNTAATRLSGWYIYNSTASVIYVKLYNATAANVTVGSTTPVMTIPIPANGGSNVGFHNPILFGTALSAAATTGVADADTGAPAANALIANFFYR